MDITAKTQDKTDFAPVLIREIEAAIKRFNMYPAGHPASRSAAEIPYNTLKQILNEHPHVIISLLEGQLAVNGRHVEGIDSKTVILEALTALDLHSISLGGDLTLDDFQSFLKYFIGKTGGRITWNPLQEYISENSISGVAVNELRYELVGKDQTVVSSDAMILDDGMAASLSGLFGDHPELILGLLVNKHSARAGIPEKYASCMDFSKLSDAIKDEIGELSDEQMMGIIVAGLKEYIGSASEYDEVDVQETLFKIADLLKKRNQAELLPKVRRLAEEINLIDRHYLDLILDKKHSRKRLAFDELEAVRENLSTGQITPEKMALIAKRLEIYGDKEYTGQYIKGLADQINSGNENWQALSSGFDSLLISAVESGSQNCLKELYDQILEKLKSFDTPPDKFGYFLKESEHLVVWLSEEENLPLLKELFDVISIYTSDDLVTSAEKRQAARDYYERVGTNEIAGRFIKMLDKKFEALNKVIFEVLKHLQTQAVAMKLCEYLSYSGRSIRLFVIRILSEYDWAAARSFEIILSDKKQSSRSPGQNLLPLEYWYKLRNIILISGNIATPEALKILEGFVSDPDPRIAEEMILALEKIKSEKSCELLTSYLYFNDSKIRHRAAVALGNIGDDCYLNRLIDAFGNENEMKDQLFPIIARLGREKVLPFFRQLLLDQKDSAWKSFLGKSGDEIKMQILSALIKIPSQKTLKLLDDYKSSFSRGLGALFKNNRLLAAVEDTRRAVLKKINP
jgi:hypothetical protein